MGARENLDGPPRRGSFADRRGNYELAVLLHKPVLDPGDTVRIEVFFTGYGEIASPKLTFYPSDDVFDYNTSIVHFGMQIDGNYLRFGGDQSHIDGSGSTFILTGGPKPAHWKESTLFFDATDESQPQIATEKRLGQAPIDFNLVTKKTTRPGTYNLRFVFTYFDGTEWRSSAQDSQFTIRSLLQRNEGKVVLVGFLAAVATIISAIPAIIALLNMLAALTAHP
jgi:hypothetical protein